MALSKIGYAGPLVFELPDHGDAERVAASGRLAPDPASGDTGGLGRAVRPSRSRERAHQPHPMHVYIEDIAKHEGQPVTITGWLANRRSSGKIHFLQVRDGSGFIQAVMSKAAVGDEVFTAADHLSQESAVVVTGTVRADARAPGGFEIDVTRPRRRQRGPRLPDHAEGTRRRLPDGSAPPVDSVAAPAGDPARPARSDRRRARLLQQPRLHPGRHADLHAVGLRGHDARCSRCSTSRTHGLSDAERPALQRSQRDGARPRVLLRPDVPRREVEDAPPPDRVLDGRAGSGLRDARRRHRARRRPGRRRRRPRARSARSAS